MSATRKITEEEWDLYKNDIRTLYVAQNMTREQVMKWMEEKHNFAARFLNDPPAWLLS